MTTRAGLRTWLGVSDGHIAKWIAKGLPRAARGKYDKTKIAIWLDMTPDISKAVKIIARKYLADHQAKKMGPAVGKAPAKVAKKAVGKKGIKEAVERLRIEEIEAHARYQEARLSGSLAAGTFLDEWQSSFEFLSKAEPVLLKFLKDSGEVAPVESFDKWLEKKTQALVSAFRSLPSKIAPMLEGKEWPEIQKILEVELEAPFAKFSR